MKIGLMGFGTVGKGVYDIVQERRDMEVITVLDKRELPELQGSGVQVTSDLKGMLADPKLDTVVELIGGMHPALEFVTAALEAGKNVVTANKLMLSCHYEKLIALAKEKGVRLRYSAAAGGGIPWLVNLSRAARVSRLQCVWGIMNGTTNYILDAMACDGTEFDVALKEAQRLGFAEADPSSDIDGLDTRHKTTLSANIAFGVALSDEALPSFGIRNVKKCDVEAALSHGFVLKLQGRAVRTDNGVAAWVEPTLAPADTPEGNIHGCDNIIAFEGSHIGKTHFIGAGAGRYPTGYAVVQDLVDLLDEKTDPYNESMASATLSCGEEKHAYYLRTSYRNAFSDSLQKAPWGDGIKTEPVSVEAMHAFAAEAAAAGEEIFIAGF